MPPPLGTYFEGPTKIVHEGDGQIPQKIRGGIIKLRDKDAELQGQQIFTPGTFVSLRGGGNVSL